MLHGVSVNGQQYLVVMDGTFKYEILRWNGETLMSDVYYDSAGVAGYYSMVLNIGKHYYILCASANNEMLYLLYNRFQNSAVVNTIASAETPQHGIVVADNIATHPLGVKGTQSGYTSGLRTTITVNGTDYTIVRKSNQAAVIYWNNIDRVWTATDININVVDSLISMGSYAVSVSANDNVINKIEI